MEYTVKGGFPRIVVTIEKSLEKHEQGFSTNVLSLKNIMTASSNNILRVGKRNEYNFIRSLEGGSGELKADKTINGVPIDILQIIAKK